jgi:hypothetical protein
VLTVKVALVAPAGTVTLEGTAATEVLLLLRVTVAPPVGAGPLSVTVPVELFPPLTEVGLSVSEESVTAAVGVTVRDAVLVAPLSVAEMVTDCVEVTMWVETENVALVEPAGTVTLEGKVATEVLPLLRATSAPPLGAALVRVTVPWEVLPPTTLVGLRVREDSVGPEPPEPLTVRMAGATTPRYVALKFTAVVLLTDELLTVKLALVAPAATVTLEGTVTTDVLALEREITAPPLGAGLFKTTVPVELFPPVTLMGLSWKAEILAPVVEGSGLMVRPAKAKLQL